MDDFFDLARLSQPQMTPEAPIGLGGFGGFKYFQDKSRQDDALQGASGLAQLRAQLEQSKAGETNAGAPGRMADILLGNMKSQDALGDSGTILESDRTARKAKLGGDQVKLMQEEINKIGSYLNMWDRAPNEEKPGILAQMKAAGARFGKTDIGSLPPDEAEKLMNSLRRAQVRTPGYAQKEMEVQGKENVAKIAAESRGNIQVSRERLALALKKMGINSMEGNKSAYEQIQRKYMKGETLNDNEKELFDVNNAIRLYGAEVRGAAIKPQPQIQGGKIVTPQPNLPKVPSLTNEGGIGSAPKADKIKPGDMFNGKKVVGVGRNPDTGQVEKVKTEDGQVHEYK